MSRSSEALFKQTSLWKFLGNGYKSKMCVMCSGRFHLKCASQHLTENNYSQCCTFNDLTLQASDFDAGFGLLAKGCYIFNSRIVEQCL